MRRIVIILIGLIAALVAAVNAQTPEARHLNVSSDKLALDGYDPVSYFKAERPLKGKSTITGAYGGAIFRFANESNRKLFLSAPATYQPQYGGWCAYAMGANAEKVDVDPETFKVIDGKLYLFYNRFFNNTLESWNKDEARLKANADRNWSKIISTNP
ncbi:MAG TPA: YHS domain-containing (seleno)protein [Chryseosolibacter sp.]